MNLCVNKAEEQQFPYWQKSKREIVFRKSVRGAKWILCGNTEIHKFTPFVAMNCMQALPHAIFISSNLQCHALYMYVCVFFYMAIEWSTLPKNHQNGRNYYIWHIVLEQRNRKPALPLVLCSICSLDSHSTHMLEPFILCVCILFFSVLTTEYQTISATM